VRVRHSPTRKGRVFILPARCPSKWVFPPYKCKFSIGFGKQPG